MRMHVRMHLLVLPQAFADDTLAGCSLAARFGWQGKCGSMAAAQHLLASVLLQSLAYVGDICDILCSKAVV